MTKNEITLAVKYIEEHPTEDFSVELLAKKFGFNVDTFSRSFRIHTGLSVSSFICRQRLALAARDLLDGATPSELYSKYGFETHSGFSKAFKKYYKISPSEYKAQWEEYLEPAMYQSFPELTASAISLSRPVRIFRSAKQAPTGAERLFPFPISALRIGQKCLIPKSVRSAHGCLHHPKRAGRCMPLAPS